MSLLSQLKAVTTIVADTGDLDSIRQLQPLDATTNPSLILQASKQSQYDHLLNRAIAQTDGSVTAIMDQLIVQFGCEILKIIKGRVSSEVDARLSFDTQASVEKARHLIKLYKAEGIERERVLIKLAATWEGINAAEILEKEGIHCNLTLLFSTAQALACAHAKVTLISPFVGRILDWHKQNEPADYSGDNDPGVQSVSRIYRLYKQQNIQTEIMGASFRNTGEILSLAGCDLLTISPKLLTELENTNSQLTVRLSPEIAKNNPEQHCPIDTEQAFRWHLNQDQMATEKLSEGIRNFYLDQEKLADLIRERQTQQA